MIFISHIKYLNRYVYKNCNNKLYRSANSICTCQYSSCIFYFIRRILIPECLFILNVNELYLVRALLCNSRMRQLKSRLHSRHEPRIKRFLKTAIKDAAFKCHFKRGPLHDRGRNRKINVRQGRSR